MKVFDISISKKNFEDVLKNRTTPRGISVVLDDSYTHYWQLKPLVDYTLRQGELGWVVYNVGREGKSYRVKIVSVKMDGDLLIVETRRPEEFLKP